MIRFAIDFVRRLDALVLAASKAVEAKVEADKALARALGEIEALRAVNAGLRQDLEQARGVAALAAVERDKLAEELRVERQDRAEERLLSMLPTTGNCGACGGRDGDHDPAHHVDVLGLALDPQPFLDGHAWVWKLPGRRIAWLDDRTDFADFSEVIERGPKGAVGARRSDVDGTWRWVMAASAQPAKAPRLHLVIGSKTACDLAVPVQAPHEADTWTGDAGVFACATPATRCQGCVLGEAVTSADVADPRGLARAAAEALNPGVIQFSPSRADIANDYLHRCGSVGFTQEILARIQRYRARVPRVPVIPPYAGAGVVNCGVEPHPGFMAALKGDDAGPESPESDVCQICDAKPGDPHAALAHDAVVLAARRTCSCKTASEPCAKCAAKGFTLPALAPEEPAPLSPRSRSLAERVDAAMASSERVMRAVDSDADELPKEAG